MNRLIKQKPHSLCLLLIQLVNKLKKKVVSLIKFGSHPAVVESMIKFLSMFSKHINVC